MQVDQPQIDRTVLDVVDLGDQERGDLDYWLARSPRERLEAVEQIRQVLYGYDPSSARLQRVLEVAQRAPR